ncbi:hypothetical protein PsYK624_118100 [Phanerochaete sordida]|uniref:Uncharacterized protein n=1 Tax=Phanerochaete sordida TaxID=48140 RepID=A0A9P3GJW7_9APHY|nr:hypothetical protein PsYK624_118100 [Phanerochaete sordida]
MPSSTGVELASELLYHILDALCSLSFDLQLAERPDERLEWKRGLAAPGSVCKYWSEIIRPILFGRLELRNLYDVHFLESIVGSPHFHESSLADAIWEIDLRTEGNPVAPWLHHARPLSARLHRTAFRYVATGSSITSGATTVERPTPSQSLPRILPSFLPPVIGLSLINLRLTSKTELARVIDSFHHLAECRCDQISFVRQTDVIHWRRAPQRRTTSLISCTLSRCGDESISSQAILASELLRASARLNVEGGTWDTALAALHALVPDRFEKAYLSLESWGQGAYGRAEFRFYPLSRSDPSRDRDYVYIAIDVRRPNTHVGQATLPAYVESLALELSFADTAVVDALPWDGLRAIVTAPGLVSLRLKGYGPHDQDYATFKGVVSTILARTQLSWALDARKLQLQLSDEVITSANILATPSKHVVDGADIVLEIAEQVDWLLCISPNSRREYLQKVAAARAAKVVVGSAASSSDSTPSLVALGQPSQEITGTEAL